MLAVGVGVTLALANAFIRNGMGQILAFLLALPFFVICVVIAFFKYSELRIHEFVAKMIKTHFLDTTKKYQINYAKIDPVTIALALSKKVDREVVIKQKDLLIDNEKLDKLRGF